MEKEEADHRKIPSPRSSPHVVCRKVGYTIVSVKSCMNQRRRDPSMTRNR